ncbi:MAG: tryptophan-rich sensory protein [Clostridia bacterium]|nr:tryptophan-rich sensory protein [Clostridia bacterium]
MWKKVRPYIVSVAIALGVGALAAFLTRNSMDIYSEIVNPPLAPPGILFPIVWSVLYVLMGVSSANVYVNRNKDFRTAGSALTVYAVNLIMNFTWSIIFFGLRAFLGAFIWLVILLAVIITMIVFFRKISPLAAYLQVPYALWVTFAGYLNLAIWILN